MGGTYRQQAQTETQETHLKVRKTLVLLQHGQTLASLPGAAVESPSPANPGSDRVHLRATGSRWPSLDR